MTFIGQAIAFSSLVAAAVFLEIHDKPAYVIWALIFIWAIFDDWHPKQ